MASDGVHRSDQSSVNCSRNGAFILVGYRTQRISQQKGLERMSWQLTVNEWASDSLGLGTSSATTA